MLSLFSSALTINSRSSVTKFLISENAARMTLFDSLKCFFSTKPHCNVGTIGHIDHGKTTLSSAITKVMSQEDENTKFLAYDKIDKTQEEKVRGITIHACHLGYSSKNRHYAHTDCPGHLSFIKNMIAGTSQMDGAILVVAATDGVMPQTREHILLTKQIGVKDIVVYINKADIVDAEMQELVKLEVADLLDEMGYDSKKVPFIFGSALSALNGTDPEIGEKSIHELINALDEHITVPERKKVGQFVMPVNTSFTVQHKGTVAVGTVTQGVLNKGERIHVLGMGNEIKAFATDLQVFNKSVPSVEAGDNIGILMRGVKKEMVGTGTFVCTVDPARGPIPVQTECLLARCYVMTKDEGGRSKPLVSGFTSTMFVGAWNTPCKIEILSANCKEVQEIKEIDNDVSNIAECETNDKKELIAMGGDVIYAKLYISRPMIIEKGQKFFVREQNMTFMTGMVTQIRPNDRKQIRGFNWRPPKKAIIEGSTSRKKKSA